MAKKTQKELENSKRDLEQWLIDNPNHVNRPEVEDNLKNTIYELAELERNGKT